MTDKDIQSLLAVLARITTSLEALTPRSTTPAFTEKVICDEMLSVFTEKK